MDIRKEKVEASCIPKTPLRPILPKPRVIYTDRHGNQIQQPTTSGSGLISAGFVGDAQADSADACSDCAQCNWEVVLGANFGMAGNSVPTCSESSIGNNSRVNAFTFSSLLAFAETASAASMDTATGNQDFLLGSNILFNCNDTQRPQWVNVGSFSNETIPKFAPVTPEKAMGINCRKVTEVQQSCISESANEEITRQDNGNAVAGNDGLQINTDLQGPVKVSSSAVVSLLFEENHNPDKGDTNAIDLNKTPQQKPRRRKHRPKVIVEGSPAAKRKYVRKNALENASTASKESPGTSKENPTSKRKYARKTTPSKATTALEEAARESTDPKTPPAVNRTGKRKYVRKNSLNKDSTNLPADTTGECADSTTTPAEKATGKRKYVRKRVLEKVSMSPAEATGESGDQTTLESVKKSCRKALNFDAEGQTRCEPTCSLDSKQPTQGCDEGNQPKLTVDLGHLIEVVVESTEASIFHDHTNDVDQMLKRQQPRLPVPTNTDTSQETRVASSQENLSNTDIEYTIHIAEVKLQKDILSPIREVGSNCNTSTTLKEEGPAGGPKRKSSTSAEQPDTCSTNLTGIHYNNFCAYQTVPAIQLSCNFKKNRMEKGQQSTATGTSCILTADVMRIDTTCIQKCCEGEPSTSKVNHWIYTPHCDASGHPTAHKGEENEIERPKRRRSKAPTRVRDLATLTGIAQPPTYPTRQVSMNSDRQQVGNLRESRTCIEALVTETHGTLTTKKRTKKRVSIVNSASSSKAKNEEQSHGKMIIYKQNQFSAESLVNEVEEQFKHLDLNREGRHILHTAENALVPYDAQNEKHALVLYRRDGTIVPFDGPFEPIKKRRPRPKVDLDGETNRVWKLLMGNINSEGIDGTDEEKAKWWEEERNVFRGRANSFIARMHLVQGDRRFSQWKGSVVDSVIGVFLTQNVSDHLSSSAFMSLAAHFPLKSKSEYTSCCPESTSPGIDKPIVCIIDPEESTKWNAEMSNESCFHHSSMTLHNTLLDEEKELINSTESSLSSIGIISSDVGQEISCESMVNKSNADIMHIGKVCCIGEEREATIDAVSSVVSSQNSVDSPIAQTSERKESISKNNSEAEDQAYSFKLDDMKHTTSFVELLQKFDSSMQPEPYCNGDWNGGNGSSSWNVKGKAQNDTMHSVENIDVGECTSASNKQENPRKETTSDLIVQDFLQSKELKDMNAAKRKAKSRRVGDEIKDNVDWDMLRKEAETDGRKRERTNNTMDSLDWEAVRCADVNDIANTIKERGMNNMLAERIKDFLNRLVREHGCIDLEWLRDIPPDKAKEYLLTFRGLGLKSVECVRLLTLHHLAFPVDTNVGRIAVRLGWVPLQPLPESLQLHLLELYPVLESIQKYLWPRLCKLDQRTLYELHYQMITFGKVFCTKSKPNCNACPMRGECRHFASAFASARLALPGPEEKSILRTTENQMTHQNNPVMVDQLLLPLPQATQQHEDNKCSEAKWHLEAQSGVRNCDPIVEEPSSPELQCINVIENDIEDIFCEDPDEIPTIKLNIEEFTQNLHNYMQQNMELQEGDVSKALVALTAEAASIPMPKLKNVSHLRTEHHVYELPDTHPLLEQLDRREPDDPCSYLLALWTPGETADSIQPPERKCSSQEYGELCNEKTCFSCNSIREANSQIVRGTLLIPCRTAMRGSFPLNGTYFQVNEVFADHESSLNPIDVPRAWIWNLTRRTVYFGTSVPSIFKGLTTEQIQHCFWRGFVCVRGFDRKTRAPRPLLARLHFPASKLAKTKARDAAADS